MNKKKELVRRYLIVNISQNYCRECIPNGPIKANNVVDKVEQINRAIVSLSNLKSTSTTGLSKNSQTPDQF